ncbi:MAG TPA: hypothetical protein VN734_09030 [Acidobacteriaceae bacterium]|nr:hypothetical protein [Acidobacteriaceae bacterium]
MKSIHSLRRAHHKDIASESGGTFMRNVGLVSAGITVLAIGVVVGRELRERYKFHRRTPYEIYSHSGDQEQDLEFGVGV